MAWFWSAVSCYNNAKKLVLKIHDYCMNLPTYGANKNYNSLFKLADINWFIIMQHKRKIVGHALFEPVKVSAGVEIYP